MLASPEPAFLLIADISGYTTYLAGAELDHAQDILADLMTTVVGSMKPSFRLAKLEGDAAFAYLIADAIDGSRLLDTVERMYFAFRRRLRDIAQATACPCNACVLMPRLDLKVVTHHGAVIRHRIAGREELVGSDARAVDHLVEDHDVVARLHELHVVVVGARHHRRPRVEAEDAALGERPLLRVVVRAAPRRGALLRPAVSGGTRPSGGSTTSDGCLATRVPKSHQKSL